jgi:hypothetical protein
MEQIRKDSPMPEPYRHEHDAPPSATPALDHQSIVVTTRCGVCEISDADAMGLMVDLGAALQANQWQETAGVPTLWGVVEAEG